MTNSIKMIKDFESFRKLNESSSEKVTLNVTISDIDKSTAEDFLRMFAFMEWTGNVGTSRSFSGFLDGDGHFRPSIKVEGYDLTNVDMKYDGEKDDKLKLDFGA